MVFETHFNVKFINRSCSYRQRLHEVFHVRHVAVDGFREASSMNPPNLTSISRLRSIRTLVVDDSKFMRDLLGIVISQQRGFELVGTAADGRQAFRAAAALRPDVILMDFDMPFLDGLQATRLIKTYGRQIGCAPVIVLVTSEDTLECRSQAKDAGADGFVSKSEDLRSQLTSTLDRLFSESRESLSPEVVEAGHEILCAWRSHPQTHSPSGRRDVPCRFESQKRIQ
jgi:DNA-binding NarL/FixJ family response regulator